MILKLEDIMIIKRSFIFLALSSLLFTAIVALVLIAQPSDRAYRHSLEQQKDLSAQLEAAQRRGDYDEVQYLSRMLLNAQLIQGVYEGNVENARNLLNAGADPLTKDNDGNYLFDIAIHKGNQNMIELLEEYGGGVRL